ncbi:MAG: nucleotide exchange factor GrpE [Bacteroidetes bacterium]|nr:MAG: nucleotide exchange factor GrpE [Bacteroidota bacterium]
MTKDKKKTEKEIKDIEDVMNSTDNTTEKEAQKAEETTIIDKDIIEEEVQEIEENDISEESADDKKSKKGFFKKSKSKTDELKEELETANLKISEINDKYLRLYSEFDNFRKRTIKEKSDIYKTAGEDVIVSIISIIDDFERALNNTEDNAENKAHREGLILISNKFKKILESKNVKEIEAMGNEFDTDIHEAITQVPAPSEDLKDKIIDVIEKGYTMNDKVIRFSKVIIGA